ncbi:MAG TPA: hypothetical protein VFH63_01445 [candidate division Zixibacteria bacterium]|nr:hypothetical protein [candidate division Zixibacteria bacterium]
MRGVLAGIGRRLAVLVAAGQLIAACSTGVGGDPSASAPQPSPSPIADGYFVRVQGPPPGPVKPFRGEMVQHVRVVDGYVSMYFELNNIGEEAVTFLNTLYDYEPQELYTPAVRLEWEEGGNVVYTRAGRFFPSPAILQPGETGVYLMGGQPAQGSGRTVGDLVTHIKYCPTRGMDDVPSIPLKVTDLEWSASDGVTTVSGRLTQHDGAARPASPTVGVAFFNADDEFVGAVVSSRAGDPLEVGRTVPFEISGRGVLTDEVDRVEAFAWVD